MPCIWLYVRSPHLLLIPSSLSHRLFLSCSFKSSLFLARSFHHPSLINFLRFSRSALFFSSSFPALLPVIIIPHISSFLSLIFSFPYLVFLSFPFSILSSSLFLFPLVISPSSIIFPTSSHSLLPSIISRPNLLVLSLPVRASPSFLSLTSPPLSHLQ